MVSRLFFKESLCSACYGFVEFVLTFAYRAVSSYRSHVWPPAPLQQIKVATPFWLRCASISTLSLVWQWLCSSSRAGERASAGGSGGQASTDRGPVRMSRGSNSSRWMTQSKTSRVTLTWMLSSHRSATKRSTIRRTNAGACCSLLLELLPVCC